MAHASKGGGGWIGLILLLLACSGCFVTLLIDVIGRLGPALEEVSIAEIEAGRRPADVGTERWRVTGGVWLVDDAVVSSDQRSSASYRSGQTFYVAWVPYASSSDVPLGSVRVASRFELGTSPDVVAGELGDPEGKVFFRTAALPDAGPNMAGLHPEAVSVYDIDRGKLPVYWFLLVPLAGIALTVWLMVRHAKGTLDPPARPTGVVDAADEGFVAEPRG